MDLAGDIELASRPAASPSRSATAAPWEVGSAFPLLLPTGSGAADALPEQVRLYGSGRQAFAALLAAGCRDHGWTSVHLPHYYCPDVVADITGILPVHRYDCGPTGSVEPPAAGPMEVVLTVSYFGAPPATVAPCGAVHVLDATHDPVAPWIEDLRPDFVVSSLRKTLPLPDGGALWSCRGHDLPPEAGLRPEHEAPAAQMLSAMCLKAAYLAGAAVTKDAYLRLYRSGEAGLRSAVASGISDFSRRLLPALPVDRLRVRRLANSRVLAHALAGAPDLTVRAYPFGVVLECSTQPLRAALRQRLIDRAVYPAVLWDLPDDSPAHHVDYSRRMLFLHTDYRWTELDMLAVATIVRDAVTDTAEDAGVVSHRGVTPRC